MDDEGSDMDESSRLSRKAAELTCIAVSVPVDLSISIREL